MSRASQYAREAGGVTCDETVWPMARFPSRSQVTRPLLVTSLQPAVVDA
jgi:hypothetical protein